MAISSEISLRSSITGISSVASLPSVTHFESVSLLELVFRIRQSWMSPRLPLNCIVYLLLCEANCLEFALCLLFWVSRRFPLDDEFWRLVNKAVYWLPSLSTFLYLHSAFLLPLETKCYQSVILKPLSHVLVDFRCDSFPLLSHYWNITSPVVHDISG